MLAQAGCAGPSRRPPSKVLLSRLQCMYGRGRPLRRLLTNRLDNTFPLFYSALQYVMPYSSNADMLCFMDVGRSGGSGFHCPQFRQVSKTVYTGISLS